MHFVLKRSFLLLVLATMALTFQFCKKEKDNNNPNPNPVVTPTKATITVTVTDAGGKAISGVSVKLNNQNTGTTNDAGVFTFKDITSADSRFFIVSTADGYFNNSQSVTISSGTKGDVKLILTQKKLTDNIDGATGGKADLPNGVEVTFPANGFQNADGSAYTGTVKTYLAHYDPSVPNFSSLMPGGADMAGVRTDGRTTTLFSYGAISVDLESSTGAKVELKAGQKANIVMPIPASMSASAPATLPLWYFNETTGKWVEEGTATKEGNVYKGEVSHFSSWNCDVPGDRATVKGKILDCNGQPLSGVPVYIGQVSTVSREDGTFERFIPAGVSTTVYGGWGVVKTNVVGISPLTNEQVYDVGNLQLTKCLIPITGTVVACNNQSVPFVATYSFTGSGGSSQTTSNIQNGTINLNGVPGTQLNITFYNVLENGSRSMTVPIPLSGTVDLGQVRVCPDASDTSTRVTFRINNELCTFYPLLEIGSYSELNDTLVQFPLTVVMAIPQLVTYKPNYASGVAAITFKGQNVGSYTLDEDEQTVVVLNLRSSDTTLVPNLVLKSKTGGNLTITKYGEVGERVEGTFEGTFLNNNTTDEYTITEGKFSVKRRQ